MAREDFEEPNVVLVELSDPELREDDDTVYTRAVPERHGDHRLLDVPGARDRHGELAVERVREQERLARLRHAARDALADLAAQALGRLLAVFAEVAAERDRDQVVDALSDVDATGVVVEKAPELVNDELTDPRYVVQSAELPGEAPQHLHVRD